MADPFIAEIRIFPFNFAPKGWAFCAGQLLPISQNTALFSLLWTTYGGDGKSNFALPDLQGMAPMHPEQGPGLSLHDWGESMGTDTVMLQTSEMPAHQHSIYVSPDPADISSPSPARSMAMSTNGFAYQTGAPNQSMRVFSPSGGDQPHNNMMPYLTLNFCIALQGIYPPRS